METSRNNIDINSSTTNGVILQVFCCLGKKRYFLISSNVTTLKLPFFMSSSPLRKISTIAGEDIIYSVSSIARFFADSFLRAFKTDNVRPVSSIKHDNKRAAIPDSAHQGKEQMAISGLGEKGSK